jgi:PAS domain S-box-containing protein
MTADDMPDANTSNPRLLFVEDEATLREHLAQKLSDTYVVDTAGNGNEALLAVMRAKPALVVTDIVMPDMDGVELLVTLRQNPGTRSIPVLLISGRAADEYRIEGFKQGADGFLAKPYTEQDLRALIGSMLRSAQLRAEAAARGPGDRAGQHAAIEPATLLDRINDVIFAFDRQWRFTYANQRALEFLGKQRTELLSGSCWEVFPRTQSAVLEEQFSRSLRDSRSVSFETLSPVTGDWIELHTYPTPEGLAVSLRDINQRKQMEKELQQALTQLRESERLADELRNPLAAVRNGVQILRLRSSAEQSELTLDLMDRQMSHLNRLVDDLLDPAGSRRAGSP